MKNILIPLICIVIAPACRQSSYPENTKKEIYQTEKDFEKMASEKGLAEAFYFFAADNAVIHRGNDSLISGKENIKHFYEKNSSPGVTLTWTPDFIDVSDCGTLGYTYGKYLYSRKDSLGNIYTSTGIFHTVWKKQNNSWKFVWD